MLKSHQTSAEWSVPEYDAIRDGHEATALRRRVIPREEIVFAVVLVIVVAVVLVIALQ